MKPKVPIPTLPVICHLCERVFSNSTKLKHHLNSDTDCEGIKSLIRFQLSQAKSP